MGGGHGDDQFVVDATWLSSLTQHNTAIRAGLDGGAGTDTVALVGALPWDWAAQPQLHSRIQGLEAVDLRDSDAQVLRLSAQSVLAVSQARAFSAANGWSGVGLSTTAHQLWVQGNANDTLAITEAQADWAESGSTASHLGQAYRVFTHTSGHAQLLVSSVIQMEWHAAVL